MAKQGSAKTLVDPLLQGLAADIRSAGGSSRGGGAAVREARQEEREARQEAREEAREARREERQEEREERQAAREWERLARKGGGLDDGGTVKLVSIGTSGNDSLTGTAGVDTLDGGDGNDILEGLAGADTLLGASGADSLFGGDDGDFLFGGLGNDTVLGGDGDDTIIDGRIGFTGPDQLVNFPSSSITDAVPFVTSVPGSGQYWVSWNFAIHPNPSIEVHAQRFDISGASIGGAIFLDSGLPFLDGQTKGEVQIVQMLGPNFGKLAAVFFSYNPPSGPMDEYNAYLVTFRDDGLLLDIEQLSFASLPPSTQSRPTVAATSDGGLIVAWQDLWRDTGPAGPAGWGVYAARWGVNTSNGMLFQQTPDTHISSNQTIGNQEQPQAIGLSDGNFVILWNSDTDGGPGNSELYFRIVNGGAFPIATPMLVNTNTSGSQFAHYKNMAVLADTVGQGSFIVVWAGQGPSGTDGNGIFFRRFNNDGTAIDAIERQVNDTTGSAETWASVAALHDGGFFVVWQAFDEDGQGIFGRRFDANGNAVSDQILINSTVAGDQLHPSVATLANGSVVVAWDGPGAPPAAAGGPRDVFRRIITFGSVGGNDTFNGGTGNDRIEGHDGNDILSGEFGDDTLFGGAGDDTLIGGAGADRFDGGAGNDLVTYSASALRVSIDLMLGIAQGDAFNDSFTGVENLIGTDHNDQLHGDESVNLIYGGDGNDGMSGRGGNDSLFGGSGLDILSGDSGNDVLFGGDGNDSGIFGGAGDDTINGNAGDDVLWADAGSDWVVGGTGNDFMIDGGDANGDRYEGGGAEGDGIDNGSDMVGYQFGTSAVVVNLTTGVGAGGAAEGDTYSGIEHVVGGEGDDVLIGNELGNSLDGGRGDDTLVGLVGDDTLVGGSGDDRLLGDNGNDLLEGGAGSDSLLGGVGVDSLFGGLGDDVIDFDIADAAVAGGGGVDTLLGSSMADQVQLDAARFQVGGFADIEHFLLGDGNDVFLNTSSAAELVNVGAGLNVFGGSGRDQISMRGAPGVFSGMDDVVDGGAGNDVVWGGFGNDLIRGGANDDQLYGGKGDDTLDGGGGFDVFYVGHDEGLDWIVDDAAETNGLVLFWGWDSTFGGLFDGLDPDEVSIVYSGNDVRITLENGGEVHFLRAFNGSTWDSPIDVINLWDYGQGDGGNATTAPGTFARDVWSSTFDPLSGEFTAFTLAVNG